MQRRSQHWRHAELCRPHDVSSGCERGQTAAEAIISMAANQAYLVRWGSDHGQGSLLRYLYRQQPWFEVGRFLLQPRLQRISVRGGHSLDSCQEPDVLGRSNVVPPRPESSRELRFWAQLLRSRPPSTSSRTRTPSPGSFAFSVTSDPNRLTTL